MIGDHASVTMPATIPVREFGCDVIRVACRRCELHGVCGTEAMIDRVGPNYPMTRLLLKIAVALGCEAALEQAESRLLAGEPRCALYYVDLAGGREQQG